MSSGGSAKMKITIKTLKHEEYQFECEPTDTILSLKQQIHARLQHEIDWQTLIYSGSVLPNAQTIASCKIVENGFMVLMVKKPRTPAPATEQKPAASTPQAPATATAASTPTTPTPAASTSATTQPTSTPAAQTTTTPAAQTPAAQTPATSTAPPPVGEEVVARIMELGFSRDDVTRALEVGWNNPDRAVEILMMGTLPPLGGGIPGSLGSGFEDGEELDDDEEGGNPFDFIKNTPHFQRLRLLAQQNPQMFEQVLGQFPPEILQLINQNQEEFLRLLQEEPVAPTGGAAQPAARRVETPFSTIRVSPEDEAVINNLVDMTGVAKDQVIRAYTLFEKDAEMTANYLLNHGHDDMGGFGQ